MTWKEFMTQCKIECELIEKLQKKYDTFEKKNL